MLFSDNLEGINLRLTLGMALDKQTDISDISESELQPYLTDNIFFPPPHFFNKDISLNAIPPKWVALLGEEHTAVQ